MKTRTVGEILHVGEFDNLGAANSILFKELVRATLRPEHRFVDVDLSRATFIDSDGLGALVSVHKHVVSKGGRARLVGVSPRVRELLRMTRMEEVFEFASP